MTTTTIPEKNELERLRKYVGRLEKILEISQVLNSNRNLDSLLMSIIDVAADLTETEAASIMLLDSRTGTLHFEAVTGQNREEVARAVVPLQGSIAGWIVSNGRPLTINDVSTEPLHYTQVDEQSEFQTRAILGVPLQVKERTIGVLEVVNPKQQTPFADDDIQVLTTLAANAAVAIENARLFEQKDQIADIVHELRTPLTSIVGFSQILSVDDQLDEESRRSLLSTIHRESVRLGQMVNDFLDLARLESRRTTLNKQTIDLNEVVTETIQIIQQQAEEKQIKLRHQATPMPLTTQADFLRIKQVLLNLLSNAIKYNKEGGQVNTWTRRHNGQAEIIISDTGYGIPADALERIFDKFYRINSHKSVAKGTGLGLSIVKEIVEAHGGSIDVTSQVDEGSTFTLKLPLET